jgi:type IV secretory pathway VirB2 component (pilin)
MSAAHSGRNSGPGAPGQDDPAALIEDINRTRADLGDTVEALVAKVDVKAQAQQRAAVASAQAKEKLQALRQQLAGQHGVPFAVATVAAAGAGALTGWLMARRRR